MRIKTYIIIIFITAFNLIKAQSIAPYLEVQNNIDFNLIKIDSAQSTFQFNHLIGDIEQIFHYTNNAEKPINLRFIVPQNAMMNVYFLEATYDNQKISLSAKPTHIVRQEIKNLKTKNSYKNQLKTSNLILQLPNVKPLKRGTARYNATNKSMQEKAERARKA